MSSTLVLGRVRAVYKGEYDPSVAYEAVSVVVYEGTSYQAAIDVPAGNAPMVDSPYWFPIGFRGEQGPQGEPGSIDISGIPDASTTQRGLVRFASDSEITAENTTLATNAAQFFSVYVRVATAEGRITNLQNSLGDIDTALAAIIG